MQIYLNRPRTKLVTYLQQKQVGRHKHSSEYSTTRDSHYKGKVFTDDVCFHDTTKDESQYI